MRKIMIVLMPITIIIAIICVIYNKDISYYSLLNGLSQLEFEEFPSKEIQDALNQIDFGSVWNGIWDNINNIADFFGALGNSFKAIWESITMIGKMLWGVIWFILCFFRWMWVNFIMIIQFIGNYVGLIYD